MNYNESTREMLIQRIEELEMLNRELLSENEKEATLEYAWTGNLGHWYWNVKTNSVTFHPLKITTLGYEKSDIPEQVTYQFFTELLHPEDYEKAMNAMKDHLYGREQVYEVEYRIRAKDGKYRWYYDRGKVTQYDDEGKPLFLAGIVFDVTEKRESQQALEQKNVILSEMSSTDGLTKISNHRTLIERIKFRIDEANRTQQPFSVAMFDIDNFKLVNDSKGHVYGDQVLVDVAKIITSSIRGTDLAGRYGGEEFMIIFDNTELNAAVKVAERIRVAVEEFAFIDGLKITISGGVKQFGGEGITDLIHMTDNKLYEAKNNGKNQVKY
jgi:diguanylate cyclase (GGDEF)-like protein/PAS domain S-box-containing protein